MSPELSLERVVVDVGRRRVLAEVSLEVGQGEILVLLGPSAAGKSTLIRLVLGLVPPSSGVVRLGGQLASAAGRIVQPPQDRNLAVVFQDLALWPHLSVHGNLAFGLEARGVPRSERERRIAAMLERVGLGQSARRYPGELSGGERQRVAIARALVLAPRAVLLDEPLANVDVALKRELMALFAELLSDRNRTVIYVTHEPREAAALGDRIAVMEQGRIVQIGTTEELSRQPATSFVRVVVDELGSAGLVSKERDSMN